MKSRRTSLESSEALLKNQSGHSINNMNRNFHPSLNHYYQPSRLSPMAFQMQQQSQRNDFRRKLIIKSEFITKFQYSICYFKIISE